ncbi:MAG: YkgJ family cysteine cluster protein [Candidatus Kapaibacterium sp.]
MQCRSGCGACCIAPSITTAFYAMPAGKKAGERCVHLDANMRCKLFGKPERPAFCSTLPPSPEMCGTTSGEAMQILQQWEIITAP